MKVNICKLASICLLAMLTGCNNMEKDQLENETFQVPYEQFTLDNGLKVIFHIDNSDPVVAVALTSHVGSAREKEGRTGFAHLFEHLLFLESENLGKGGLDKMSARIGGSGANGSTSRDRTNYFQTVPNDALEKMIWAEADKLGFFINTVTEDVLAKEKQVVKNEKRQRVDNQPYGHANYVIGKNLYPANHPYSWTVIGSLEDLQNATLQDVKDFYNRWYVPNNVTLTISGDFEPEQARTWVEKYFDEIPKGEEIPPMEKQMVTLEETKKLYYEDNFARLPQLTLTWPGVYQFHEDAYALDVLTNYLSRGKNAPLYKKLVAIEKLTSNVGMYSGNSEIAGEISLSVVAFDGYGLDKVMASVQEAFEEFESKGISEEDLNRIKAGQETQFYRGLGSVQGKGFQLAQYQIFAGDPGFISKDVENILAVTSEDVMKVYNKYIKDKHLIATSFVPKGKVELALEDSDLAEVVEEEIVMGAEETFDASQVGVYEKTPSSFDRSIEPPYGILPELKVPEIWKNSLSSGIEVFGIFNNEVPMVQLRLEIAGGMLLEQEGKAGVANLLAQMLTKGTANRTPAELEAAIESLGASINASAGKEHITLSASSLAKNYDQTLALFEEILLEPRWDEVEFDLLKKGIESSIQRQKANPGSIANNEFSKLIYGAGHVFANAVIGNENSVAGISIDDLKSFYTDNIAPNISKLYLVGAISEKETLNSLADLDSKWLAKDVTIPDVVIPEVPKESAVYFYDVPGAKQSVIMFGYPALAVTSEDYYPATIMNYRLGGGGFASQLTQELREGKGYTYGIRSGFSGSRFRGPFSISSSVRSNVTYESAQLIKDILKNYGMNFSENDLEVTKSYLIKSSARAFETLGSKLGLLQNVGRYGFSPDYVKTRQQIVKDMTVEEIQAMSAKYLNPEKMIYLFVGDAATQLDRLNALGYGTPILLNP